MANAVPEHSAARGDRGLPRGAPGAVRAGRRSRTSGWRPARTSSSAGRASNWPAAHGTSGAARTFVYLFDWESPAFDGMLGLDPRARAALRVRRGAHAGGAVVLGRRTGRGHALPPDADGVARLCDAGGPIARGHRGVAAVGPSRARHDGLRLPIRGLGRRATGHRAGGARALSAPARFRPADQAAHARHPQAAGGGCPSGGCSASTPPVRRARSGRTRASTSSSATRISRRARCAPRQKWAPWPNVRCGFGSRSRRNCVGCGEVPFVAVGRALPDHDLLPGLDRLAAELAPHGRGAAFGRRRRRPAEDLLDGRRHRQAARCAADRAGRANRRRRAWHRRWRCASSRLPPRTGARRRPTARRRSGAAGPRRAARRGRRRRACRARGVARFSSMRARPYSYMRSRAAWRCGGHGEEVRLVGDVEDVLDRFEEEVTIALGDAEQQADRLHRQLGREVEQEVELVAHRLRGGPASAGAAPPRGSGRPPA